MALHEKVYVIANQGKVVAVLPGDTTQTNQNAAVGAYRSRNPGGTYSIIEVPVANLLAFNSLNELFGKGVSPTGVISDYTPSDSIANAQRTVDWKYRLYEAFQTYNDPSIPTSRQDWWPSKSGITGTDALIATDRWAYAQVALGDLIADRSYGNVGTSEAVRETAIAHICNVLETLGRVWYGVMLGASTRNLWKASSIEDGSLIYSDIIVVDTIATRGPDGSFTPMGPADSTADIATGFKVDSPTLR